MGVKAMIEKPSRFARTPKMTERARGLRLGMSPIERQLWSKLRRDQLGVSFRRQHPVGPYVLDFYCPALKLAVELDGDDHALRVDSDAQRSAYLARSGIAVVRFSNRDVVHNLSGVWESLLAEIKRRRD